MIPDQRDLVRKFAGKPFTMIGINSDKGTSEELEKRFKDKQITWPQMIEGRERALSQSWNVQSYPTLFVIDKKGVIRARNMHDMAELTTLVEKLLGESVSG